MNGYLGETDVTNSVDTSNREEMALMYIHVYGGIDGDHHKAWVLDQVARILNNAPITVKEARWDNGYTELRYSVGTCEQYKQWVYDSCYDEEDGEWAWDYNEGIPP